MGVILLVYVVLYTMLSAHTHIENKGCNDRELEIFLNRSPLCRQSDAMILVEFK